MVTISSAAGLVGFEFSFDPSARTAWHPHPLGQTLIVMAGCGWVQREGGPIEEIRLEDVVWFSPGEKHWHGATPATAMTNIAIQEKRDENVVDWMEQVSDEQYRVGKQKEIWMSNKPARNDVLRNRLARSREINISVIGRKSGRAISNPVWFVLDEDKLYLLPVQGSDTQWYKNVLKNPSIRIGAGSVEAELKVVPVTDAPPVASVVEKFRDKYGTTDVRKYYSKFDVAVVAQMR